MIHGPPLAQKNAAAVPSAGAIPSYLPPLPAPLPMLPILPLAPPPPPPVPSSKLAVLEEILDGPEVQSRPDLQPMVQLIRSDLKRPMPPAEMQAVIIAAAQQLMKALKPQPQAVFMPQPPPVWNPAPAATTVASASADLVRLGGPDVQRPGAPVSGALFSEAIRGVCDQAPGRRSRVRSRTEPSGCWDEPKRMRSKFHYITDRMERIRRYVEQDW
jgi:hypothetical protein